MNPELKAYLDEWEATNKRIFDKIHDSFLQMATALGAADNNNSTPAAVTTDCVTAPVPASSDPAELVTASAGPADPPALVITTEKSLMVAPTVLIDTISVAPTNCSTESPSHEHANKSTPASTPAPTSTSPTATVEVTPLLAAAAADGGVLDGEPQPRFAKALDIDVIGFVDIGKLDYAVSHETADVEVLTMVDFISYVPGEDWRPPWPPSSLNVSKCDSSDVRPMPWPSFSGLLGGIHLAEPRPPFQERASDSSKSLSRPHFEKVLGARNGLLWGSRKKTGLKSEDMLLFANTVVALYSSFPRYTCMRREKSKRNGKLIQWLARGISDFELLQWKIAWSHPWEFSGPNLAIQECLLATTRVKKIATSLTAMGLLQLHFVVFSGDSEWWSNCGFLGCTYGAYNCWGAQCDELGASTSVLQEFVGTSNCYLHLAAIQNLGTLVCCAWAILWLLSGGYNSVDYFWMTWDPGSTHHCIRLFCCRERSDNCSLFWTFEKEKQVSDSILSMDRILLQRYNCFHTRIFLGVRLLNNILLHNQLVSWFIRHANQCGFGLLKWKTAWSRQWGCSEIVAWLVFITRLRPPGSYSLLDDMKHNTSDLEDAAATSAPHTHTTALKTLKCSSCIFVPAEFGDRGISRLICAAKYAGQTKVLHLGIFLRMQLSVIEVSKHVLGLGEADTATNTPDHVILYLPKIPVIIDPELLSQTNKAIRLIWSRKLMELIRVSEQGSNFPMSSDAGISVWIHVKCTQWSWDPGGSMFALCSSDKSWTTTLHHNEQLQWSSLRLACAFRIWLVAWTVFGSKFFTGCGQAPFQGRRVVIRAIFSDQVHISHDYHIVFFNPIPIDYDYYLEQAYYFDAMGSDLIYHHENYRGDCSKTKGAHMPWDPGKVSPSLSREASAWGQAEFQGGRDVRTLTVYPMLGCRLGLALMGQPQSLASVLIQGRRQRKGASRGWIRTGGGTSSPTLALTSHSPSCLFLCLARKSLYPWIFE